MGRRTGQARETNGITQCARGCEGEMATATDRKLALELGFVAELCEESVVGMAQMGELRMVMLGVVVSSGGGQSLLLVVFAF